jgi:hypothetical protein
MGAKVRGVQHLHKGVCEKYAQPCDTNGLDKVIMKEFADYYRKIMNGVKFCNIWR